MLLLHLFPEGVEELDGAFAVYADEPPIGFDVLEVDDVREGWEDSWREFHHGVAVGRFWVGPPWEDPPPELEPIVVDPGRAFGTGAHATTRLSLELLQSIEPGSLLDIGCGSGVLSIGAAKLGFAPVIGVDLDEAAIEATNANARANGVEIEAHVADALADTLPRTEIAVANVALDVVERLAPRLDARLFVTSGYLDRDEPRLDRLGARPTAAPRTAGRPICSGISARALPSQGVMRRVMPLAIVLAAAVLVPAGAGGADPDWKALERPLHLPTLGPDGRCPASKLAPQITGQKYGVGGGLGPGPVYPILSRSGLVAYFRSDLGPWAYQKVLWFVLPDYVGPVLIRGRRLGGTPADALRQRHYSAEEDPHLTR